MPTQRFSLTKAADQAYHTRLSRLKQLGVQIGCAGDPSYEPERLRFEQVDHEFARIYELPSFAVAVVVPAKMIVLKSGILITDVTMMTPWDGCNLDLRDPEENFHYKDLIAGLPHYPPRLLNPYLERELPLGVRQLEGLFVAIGDGSILSSIPDETPVTVELSLKDERGNELCFDFRARMDRRLMRKWERRHREQYVGARWAEKSGLYAPLQQPRDQKSILREGAIKPPHTSSEHRETNDSDVYSADA